MKKIILLAGVVLFFEAAYSQNVGVGTNAPKSKLDVNGGLTIGTTYSGVTAAPANGALIQGTVAITTPTPDASAILDMSGSSKGVRFPQATLTGVSDATTIPAPAKGLVVWNTGLSWGSAALYVNTGSPGTPSWDKVSTGAGTVTNVTASAPLSSSGGTTPNISLTGTVPVANGGTGLTTIGAGQILIGQTGGTFLNTNLTGTTNQVNVANASGSITLSTPQNLDNAANVTFGTVTGGSANTNSLVSTGSVKVGTTTAAATTAGAGAVRWNSPNVEYSDGSSWKTISSGGTVTSVTASNGLTSSGGNTPNITLGGTLTGATSIAQAGNNFGFTGGNIGVGTSAPNAVLTVGAPLSGSALSTTMVTDAGALGTTLGNTLNLASIGFSNSAGNSSTLGIHALRTAAGNSWTTTAIGLLMDVDNTSPVNNASIWFNSSGNIGIGTSAPVAKLDVVGSINTNTGYTISGTAASGNYLRGNGSTFVSSGILAADIPTGSGNYIQNGTSAQSASYNITGSAIIGTTLSVGSTSYFGAAITGMMGVSPPNNMVRLTPNLHLNAGQHYAVIVNWDNGNSGSDLNFRVGNGASADVFDVLANGTVGIGTSTPAYTLDLNSGTFGFGASNVRTEYRTDAGLQGNAGAQSGFFQNDGSTVTDYPAGASGWWHLIDCRHSNSANNFAMQIAGSFFDQSVYVRKTNNSASTAWSRVYTNSDFATVTYTNSTTTSGHFAVIATCGTGGTLISGGCYDNGDSEDGKAGNTALVFSYPYSSTQWRCGSRDIGSSESRTLTAYAICTK